MGLKNRAKQYKEKAKSLRDKAGRFKGKAKEKLKGLIPSKYMAKWKLIAEGSLAVIIIVGLFEIAHYFFKVHFSKDFLIALEVIDYLAIFILAIDLIHHYLISPRKERFIKNKFIYILSFIPYLIFHKAMGVFYLFKPVFTGIAKLIKLFSHSEDIKDRIEDVAESVEKATTAKKPKKKKENK